ncbi:MAG: DNA alkylation repair protein, partial [Bdellovibrionaceae bacterium]|nr:DNA alkylation repair protein [Pseudobdellovibrionaceae bacterium]
VMLLSSYFVSTKSIEEKIANNRILFSWQEKVDNWAHSDELSNHYSQMLELEPKYYDIFKKWNYSENSWKRRQSLVGLLFYSRFRNRPLTWNKIKPMIENLIADHDYYVQKGIGWALREAYNLYPEVVLKYITQKSSDISSIAWVAATEKLDLNIKQEILNKRRKLKQRIKA